MEELLHTLEYKIKSLLDRHDKLKYANQELSHGTLLLARKKDDLLAKQQKAIMQIETLVSKLRSIEELP